MGFRAPEGIQTRETVSVQETRLPADRSASSIPQISTSIYDSASKSISAMSEEAQKAKKTSENYILTKFKNDSDIAADEATNEVFSARGQNSFTAGENAGKKLQRNMDKLLATVPEELRDRANLYANVAINDHNKKSQAYMLKQGREVMDGIYKTRAALLTDQAALAAYDEKTFNTKLKQIDYTTNEYVRQLRGGDPSIGAPVSAEVELEIKAQQLEAKSTAVYKTIEALVSQSDVKTAEYYAKTYEGITTSSDRVRINALLKKGRDNAVDDAALGIMNQALKMGHNEVGAKRLIQDLSGGNAKLYKSAVNLYDNARSTALKQENENRDRALSRSYEEIRKGGIVDMKKIDPRDRAKVEEFMRRNSTGDYNSRNPEVHAYLYDMMRTNPTRFSDPTLTNINAYSYGLAKSDVDFFNKAQQSMQDPTVNKFKINDVNDIVNDFINTDIRAKYSPTKSKEKYYAGQAEYRQLAMEVLDEVKASMGERASLADVRKKFSQEFEIRTRPLTDKRSWWQFWKDPEIVAEPRENVILKAGEANVQGGSLLDKYPANEVETTRIKFLNSMGYAPSEEELIQSIEGVRALRKLRKPPAR